jgi:hypothetical protein
MTSNRTLFPNAIHNNSGASGSGVVQGGMLSLLAAEVEADEEGEGESEGEGDDED